MFIFLTKSHIWRKMATVITTLSNLNHLLCFAIDYGDEQIDYRDIIT
jgi:hypothetical protein